VRLLIHPRVGPLDPERVAEVFHDAISRSVWGWRVMGLAWHEGHVLRVERRAPLMTSSGKILHLHASGSPGDPRRPETTPGRGRPRLR
jgi:hypothetical protein